MNLFKKPTLNFRRIAFTAFPIAAAGGVVLFLLLVLLGAAGCASTSPPTALERQFFDIKTNYTPVIQVVTNVVPVTLYKTNEVTQTITNAQNVVEVRTNVTVIPVTVYQTNTVPVTNAVASGYLYTPNAKADNVKEVGTAVGGLAGVGGLVGTGLGALFSLWGYLRSSKNMTTATALAQNIEMIREFVKTLPNGAQYDATLTNFMQKHQAEAGVLNNVVTLLEKSISNNDAQIAAEQIKNAIDALSATPPTAPVAKT